VKLAPKYVGSPMLSALYGVWAAWLGDRRRSLELFDEGYSRFVEARFLQTSEYRPDKFPEQPRAAPFVANLSGFLLSLLDGLPGLRLGDGQPSTWPSRAVVLPARWKAIEVERLWVRGRPARLIARHGDERARLATVSDDLAGAPLPKMGALRRVANYCPRSRSPVATTWRIATLLASSGSSVQNSRCSS